MTMWQTLPMTTQETPRAAVTQTHKDKNFFYANILARDKKKNGEGKRMRFLDRFEQSAGLSSPESNC